jgi:hypothetical protein
LTRFLDANQRSASLEKLWWRKRTKRIAILDPINRAHHADDMARVSTGAAIHGSGRCRASACGVSEPASTARRQRGQIPADRRKRDAFDLHLVRSAGPIDESGDVMQIQRPAA